MVDEKSSLLYSRRALRVIRLIAFVCGVVATGLAIRYADQKPLDLFAFRQTQTALTAYWLVQKGFSLAYETPIAGAPWSIPFEFPLYQYLVALVSQAAGASLDATARLVSYGFLLACLFPVRTITRRLALSPLVFPLFCVLLLSSPTYLYWGRTVMIETAAVFLVVCAIRHFVDLLFDPQSRRSAALFVVFMSLGMLQKITTALPVLIVLAPLLFIVRGSMARRDGGSWIRRDVVIQAALCFGIPVLIGLGWTFYTDGIKQLNPFGQQLTSSQLRSWNLGTLEQRLTKPLYRDVVEGRIFDKNMAGYFGLLLLVAALTQRWFTRSAWILWIALALGLLPVLLFPNLHLVHDYYECGNLIFFLFALAVALGDLLVRHMRSVSILTIAILFIVVQNYRVFASDYLPAVQAVYTDADDTEMAIATVIRSHVPADRVFVAFDFDWSSSLAYLSERKAFMMSAWFKQVEAARSDPTRFVDRDALGAVVACPKSEQRLRQLVDWSTNGRAWKVGLVDDCYVAMPEDDPASRRVEASTGPCEATAIAVLPVRQSASLRVVRIRLPRPGPEGADRSTYVTGTATTDLHEMLDVTRRSPRPGIDRGALPDRELTRLIVVRDGSDVVAIRVLRKNGDRLDECRVASVHAQNAGAVESVR